MDDDYFPMVDVDPPEESVTRNLVVLLLDVSGSMGEVDSGATGIEASMTKIDALRSALSEFLERSVHSEPKLEANGELAIVTFGGEGVNVLSLGTPVLPGSPFHFVRNIHYTPFLGFGGGTPMGSAILYALEIIEERKMSLAKSGIAHESRPNMFLLTDGMASDWRDAMPNAVVQLHAEEAANGVLLWALGTSDADRGAMTRLANKGNYFPLPHNSIAQFLQFVSTSMRHQSGAPGQDTAEVIYSHVARSVSFDDRVDELFNNDYNG